MATNLSALAKKLLRYEPETGKLFWLPRPAEMFPRERIGKMWNARFANTEAFTSVHSNGYLQGAILGRMYRAHRVIWLIQTGQWPVDQIDHINGVRADNRWSNLREVSHGANLRNCAQRSNNSSGVTGVSWHRLNRKWAAQITIGGRKRHLGSFPTIEAAAAARAVASAQHGFSARHGTATKSEAA